MWWGCDSSHHHHHSNSCIVTKPQVLGDPLSRAHRRAHLCSAPLGPPSASIGSIFGFRVTAWCYMPNSILSARQNLPESVCLALVAPLSALLRLIFAKDPTQVQNGLRDPKLPYFKLPLLRAACFNSYPLGAVHLLRHQLCVLPEVLYLALLAPTVGVGAPAACRPPTRVAS